MHEEELKSEETTNDLEPEVLETTAEQEPEASPTPEPEKSVDEVSILKDQLLRTLAEFENYKKRTQKEREITVQYANERLIVELLPVLDDMERAMKVASQLDIADEKVKNAFQGFEIIYRKMVKTLEEKGLKPMQSIGEELNVDLHDALMQVEAEGKDSNIIVDEHEKGYYLGDKLIRHAKVIVTK